MVCCSLTSIHSPPTLPSIHTKPKGGRTENKKSISKKLHCSCGWPVPSLHFRATWFWLVVSCWCFLASCFLFTFTQICAIDSSTRGFSRPPLFCYLLTELNMGNGKQKRRKEKSLENLNLTVKRLFAKSSPRKIYKRVDWCSNSNTAAKRTPQKKWFNQLFVCCRSFG